MFDRLFRALSLLATLAFCLMLPTLALAQEAGGGLANLLSGTHEVAPWIAICSAIATVALALSNFLPGWATKLNILAAVAAGVGSALGALGPTATIFAILIAAGGAVIGYHRSETRAEA